MGPTKAASTAEAGTNRLPSRQILTDAVYEAVKKMVMDHELGPGERLNIEDLARRLQVSATPIREALARLESDGLVSKRALSGYSVAPLLDSGSLAQLFEVRHLLEPHAARRAASTASDDEVRALDRLVSSMKTADTGAIYDEYRNFALRDTEFHRLIASCSRNPMLEEMLARLHFHWHLYRLHFAVKVGMDTTAEHMAIAAAIRHRDPEAAAAAMDEHLTLSHQRLLPALRREYLSKTQ